MIILHFLLSKTCVICYVVFFSPVCSYLFHGISRESCSKPSLVLLLIVIEQILLEVNPNMFQSFGVGVKGVLTKI